MGSEMCIRDRYTVSDDTKAIFRLDLQGRVSVSNSFFIGLDDLEGIALRGNDSELLVVQERSNSVVVVDLNSRRERSRRPLSAMTNYDKVAHHFPDPPENNGGGITVNTRNNHVVVVKERQPGLLIELDPHSRQSPPQESCSPTKASSIPNWRPRIWISRA